MKKKILFLTLVFSAERGIYTDLMIEMVNQGHELYVITPTERRNREKTHIEIVNGIHVLKVQTLNVQKTNIIEKGISTLLIEGLFKRALQKNWPDIEFDLIIYSTPPITFAKVIDYVKGKNPSALSYLMLKDIFPQNAVDIQMMRAGSLLHKLFVKKEKKLYQISDMIGCMSEANRQFILTHNPDINQNKVEILPNTVTPIAEQYLSQSEKDQIRQKFRLPLDKTIFIYGGNLGKPQGIDYLIECLQANEVATDNFIVIVGGGTEFEKLEQAIQCKQLQNVKLYQALPKADYDQFIKACDVGLIFLDYRFTIPNFPSRLLSYLEFGMPVIAATDKHTDIGQIISDNNFGRWNESNNTEIFIDNLRYYTTNPDRIQQEGKNGRVYLETHYTSKHAYEIIMKHVGE